MAAANFLGPGKVIHFAEYFERYIKIQRSYALEFKSRCKWSFLSRTFQPLGVFLLGFFYRKNWQDLFELCMFTVTSVH